MSRLHKFSIVVPTYNRREVVQQSIASIVAAEMPWPCELIIVVDGSTDGTAEALSTLRLPLPLQVVEQENAGAARARNRGAALAQGEFLLFLDDDMAVDRRLLVEHARTLDAGADAVVGDIPLHPDSPRTLLTQGVATWADKRRARLKSAHGRLTTADFLIGQLSVRATLFAEVGGFDETLTAGGSFGGEDTDFVFRLMQTIARVKYNGDAVSHQRYLTKPAQNLRQWWQAGRADAMLSRKHPTLGATLWDQHRGSTLVGRLARRLSAISPAIQDRFRAGIVRRASAGHSDKATVWAYAGLREVAYWSGVRTGGGITRRHHQGVRILAYHGIGQVDDDAVFGRYMVSPATFEAHIDALRANGYTFINTDQLLAYLDHGTPLADRSILLTFDDGYESVLRHAAPVLARHGILAVVCVVTRQLGGTNFWEAARPGAPLPLLTADQLRTLCRAGWEIAAHSHHHAHLTTLRAADLAAEMVTPRVELVAGGFSAPRLVAYPYGEHDVRVRRSARQAGYRAGLAMRGGFASAGSAVDRFALPRLELHRDTDADQLLALLTEPEKPARPQLGLAQAAVLLRLAMDGLDRPRTRPGGRSGSAGNPRNDSERRNG